ncbi:MAG: hypothetical protein GPJ21_09100 [Microcystis aeruginosa W13-11]|nr:hypothetical protein [Microcystis aeruginosa W13-11]
MKEQYPSINLDHNNPHVLISRIILKLQNCKGALENFIELVENESERRSPERGYLRQILREIYQSPSNPLLRLEADSFVIFRLDARDKKYIIPLQFPKLEDGQLRQAMRSRDTWNIIITFCRRLYRDYMDAYKYIVSGQISLAKININELRGKCNDLANYLTSNSFDNELLSLEPISTLQFIPYCIDPLLETIDFHPNSEYFMLGQQLAEFIPNLLLEVINLNLATDGIVIYSEISIRLEPRELMPKELSQLKDGFLACEAFANRQKRNAIIDLLRTIIKANICRADDDITDTINIIKTVRNYPGGLKELLDALELYAVGTIQFSNLKHLIDRILPTD